jgi:hypothetical protein
MPAMLQGNNDNVLILKGIFYEKFGLNEKRNKRSSPSFEVTKLCHIKMYHKKTPPLKAVCPDCSRGFTIMGREV